MSKHRTWDLPVTHTRHIHKAAYETKTCCLCGKRSMYQASGQAFCEGHKQVARAVQERYQNKWINKVSQAVLKGAGFISDFDPKNIHLAEREREHV